MKVEITVQDEKQNTLVKRTEDWSIKALWNITYRREREDKLHRSISQAFPNTPVVIYLRRVPSFPVSLFVHNGMFKK